MVYRILSDLKFWYALALVQVLLWRSQFGIGGPYWFIEPLLYLVFFIGLWLDSRYHFREKLTLSRGKAVFLYFVISLATATVYEVSLSSADGLFSDYHPKPIPGFITIIGLYLSFALFNLFLIRRYHYTFKELYFSAGGASLWEGLVFGGRVLLAILISPMFFLAPLPFAYFMFIYGILFCMPFIFIREEFLWSPVKTTISFWRKMTYSFIAGFFVMLVWGLGWEMMASFLINGFEKF